MKNPILIRRERKLPLAGEVLVRQGAVVEAADLLARTELVPGNPYVVDVCRELGVPHARMNEYLTVKEGTKVRTGDVIARAGTGRNVREVRAQAAGVVEFISQAYSRVLIREEVKQDHPLITIDVAKKLGLPAWQIRSVMRVKEEDEVRQGATLASDTASSFVGIVYSPVSGIIEKICPRTGMVTVRRPYRPTVLHAFIPGRVGSVLPSFGAVIEGAGNVHEGVFGLGGEAFGPVRVACGPEDTLSETGILEEDKGRVLVGGANITAEAVRRATAVGVKGLVSGGIDIVTLESLGLGVRGITGSESFGIVLVVMHGFGTQALSRQLWEEASGFDGTASVSGVTQMRAGVKHPELLLCSNTLLPRASDDVFIDLSLGPGATVRVLMGPLMGKQALVLELLHEARSLPTGEQAMTARIELSDGSPALVPVASLKVIA